MPQPRQTYQQPRRNSSLAVNADRKRDVITKTLLIYWQLIIDYVTDARYITNQPCS
jgi:hypothetical protein